MPNVTSFCGFHRKFELGWVQGLHGPKAAWRRNGAWIIGNIYADDIDDALRLARECVDFHYRAEALEAKLGRKLTMADLMLYKGDLCAEPAKG